jgi:hypothetical protein
MLQGNSQLHLRVGGANRALSFELAGGELRNIVTLPADLQANRLHPAVHLPIGRKSLLIFMIQRVWTLGSQSHMVTTHNTTLKLQNKTTGCLQILSFIVYFQLVERNAKSCDSETYIGKLRRM